MESSCAKTPLVRSETKADDSDSDSDSNGGVICLRTLASSTMLLGVGGVVVYVSPHDPWSLVLTIGSFVILLLLYHCLHIFENTPAESPRRHTLKAAVWALSTLLTAIFTYRVSTVMPTVAGLIIWSMAGLSILGGFFLLFMYDDARTTTNGNDHLDVDVEDEKPLKDAGVP